MYAGRDYDPAEIDESQVFGLDFVRDIPETAVLIAATWSLTLISGTDSDPSIHLIGPASLVIPKGSIRLTGTQQRIAGLLPNCVYNARALVTTNEGDTVALNSHIAGETTP